MERAESFLKTGLDRRPVAVQWHRIYQTLAESGGHEAGLVARYDGYLKADPRNAALIYLRGRIDPDWDRQEESIRRAIEADPRTTVAVGGPGLAGRGGRPVERVPERPEGGPGAQDRRETASMICPSTARLGAGEAKFLADESRTRLAGNAMDVKALVALLEATAVMGPPEDFERELTAWQNRLPMQVRGQVGTTFRAIGLYESGKLPECLEALPALPRRGDPGDPLAQPPGPQADQGGGRRPFVCEAVRGPVGRPGRQPGLAPGRPGARGREVASSGPSPSWTRWGPIPDA